MADFSATSLLDTSCFQNNNALITSGQAHDTKSEAENDEDVGELHFEGRFGTLMK